MVASDLLRIHVRHAQRVVDVWLEGPHSDDPSTPAMMPLLIGIGADATGTREEWMCVARTPDAQRAVATALGRAVAAAKRELVAVTQAAEMWISGPVRDDPSGRLEVLVVVTLAASGDALSTVRSIRRSAGGEAAIGELVADAVPARGPELPTDAFDSYRAWGSSDDDGEEM